MADHGNKPLPAETLSTNEQRAELLDLLAEDAKNADHQGRPLAAQRARTAAAELKRAWDLNLGLAGVLEDAYAVLATQHAKDPASVDDGLLKGIWASVRLVKGADARLRPARNRTEKR